MRISRVRCLILALFLLPACLAVAEPIPKLVKRNGNFTLLVDGHPFLVLGAQVHNSSGWPATMAALWPTLLQLHANTVTVPVYWQAMEPQPGQFDFSSVDAIVNGARQNGLRLILSWFGTWKNGGMAYTPDWVKENPREYPRMIDRNGHPIDVLSPLSAANMNADRRAFTALMTHLRSIDGERHTVILVQVENEAGALGTDRDYSATADKAFRGPVPQIVLTSLKKTPGTWQQVFGVHAPEVFSAYYTARYIGQVAAGGKQAFPLPLYINVWPREQAGFIRPGFSSPSGGAVSYLLDMWKKVAPSIDIIGADNYDTNFVLFRTIAQRYTRPDNPLLVPETGDSMAHARHMFYVFANKEGLGISMFGVHPFPQSGPQRARGGENEVAIDYGLVGPAIPALLALRDAGHLQAAIEESGIANPQLSFDNYDAVARFGPVRNGYGGARGQGNPDLSGRVLIGQMSPNEFLIIGSNANIAFRPKLGDPHHHAELVTVEEGGFVNGQWRTTRLLNGDETYFGLILPHQGATLRVKLRPY